MYSQVFSLNNLLLKYRKENFFESSHVPLCEIVPRHVFCQNSGRLFGPKSCFMCMQAFYQRRCNFLFVLKAKQSLKLTSHFTLVIGLKTSLPLGRDELFSIIAFRTKTSWGHFEKCMLDHSLVGMYQ